jgi:hypothetical protein
MSVTTVSNNTPPPAPTINLEALKEWWDALPEASYANQNTHWRIADPRHDIFMSPPVNDYPGPWVFPIGKDNRKAATWDDMMRMPEPYKTAFLKLRILMPTDEQIDIKGVGSVDYDQWLWFAEDLK